MSKSPFDGVIEDGGPFPPEVGRNHLYIGLSCPFAHRVNLVRHIKGLQDILPISTGRLRSKPDGIPEWVFTTKEKDIPGATEDQVFGCTIIQDVYNLLAPEYKGKFTIPLLVDTKTGKIVNNESANITRNLSTGFNSLLTPKFAAVTLCPDHLKSDIDTLNSWLNDHLITGVYKSGFNPTQAGYDENVVMTFAALNKLEKYFHESGGPYLLGNELTECDIFAFPCLIRFDAVYVQHMKCNLGMIRHDYPVLHWYMRNLYWNVPGFKETTNFTHIKENYTKAHTKVNPTTITPMGPYPDILPFSEGEAMPPPGRVMMPKVLEYKLEFPQLSQK